MQWRYLKMAKSYQAGVSTLGIVLCYAPETTAGVKPTTGWTTLHRINEIGDISLSSETIDASALEDYVERTVAGRASTGGNWDVTFNATDKTIAEWKKVIADYKALDGGKRLWFQTIVPGLTDADFVVAQPPQQIPKPSAGQNELYTCTMSMAIEEYVGFDTKVAPEED